MANMFRILMIDERGEATEITVDDLLAACEGARHGSGQRMRLIVRDASFSGLLFSSLRFGDGPDVRGAIPRLLLEMLRNPPEADGFRLHSGGIRLIVEGDHAWENEYPPDLRPYLETGSFMGILFTGYPATPIRKQVWGMRWLSSLFREDLINIPSVQLSVVRDGKTETLSIRSGPMSSPETQVNLTALLLLLTISGAGYDMALGDPPMYVMAEAYQVPPHPGGGTDNPIWHLAADCMDIMYTRISRMLLPEEAAIRFAIHGSDVRIWNARINGRWAGLPLSIREMPPGHRDDGEDDAFSTAVRRAAISVRREVRRAIREELDDSVADEPASAAEQTSGKSRVLAMCAYVLDEGERLEEHVCPMDVPAAHLVAVPDDGGRNLRILFSWPNEEPVDQTEEFGRWFFGDRGAVARLIGG